MKKDASENGHAEPVVVQEGLEAALRCTVFDRLIYNHLLREGKILTELLKASDLILRYSFVSVSRVFEDIIEGQPITL